MERPDRCPECRSWEIRSATRRVAPEGEIQVWVCGNCDWVSDLRVGRPPADRSKNYTLRRLMEPSQTKKEDVPDRPDQGS
jgi:hypothetical protein